MVPDVGGLGLACPEINVLDSALLTNKFLAKNGYSKFSVYFKKHQPDIIETHGGWSKVSGIYEMNEFSDNYLPVVVNNNWLYLRRDHFNRLYMSGIRTFQEQKPVIISSKIRYRGHSIDEEYIRSNKLDSKVLFIEI